MRPRLRFALLLEVAACFGPVGIFWVMGLVLVPFQVRAVFERGFKEGPAELILSVIAGGIGLFGLAVVLRSIFFNKDLLVNPLFIIVMVVVGLAPLIPLILSGSVGWAIVGALPVLGTAHVLFLARRFLFRDG